MPAPPDVIDIFLQPGDFFFGDGSTRIRTLLGSCVAVTLWNPTLRIGGMSHYMLPQRPNRAKDQPLDGRYADEVMLMFQRELLHTHTRPTDYQVKIFGGGHMFPHVRKTTRHVDISDRNIEVGRRLVAQNGFRVAAADLGGEGHRNVILDLWSGDVWVRHADKQLSGAA